MKPIPDHLPLATLLSQALVAFTIELDNEFEHRLPHRTTKHSSTGGPWLTSMAMWSTCMRFVGDEGVTVRDLERLARTKTNLNGMQRWGYIVVHEKVIRATPKGRKAREVWEPLFDVIEKRWRERFGEDQIDQLRESLSKVIARIGLALPDCLPILGYGLFSKAQPERGEDRVDPDATLAALLSRVLLAFAIEFERESDLSLAICANVLRVLDEEGVRVRDLPLLSGVSKEAISTALGILQKKHVAVLEADSTSRGKIARLTSRGREAQDAYRRLVGAIEERWNSRFGEDVAELRDVLTRLAGGLFLGLEPYPDGWRASVPNPAVLPHYPMVLHRGGFPDGS